MNTIDLEISTYMYTCINSMMFSGIINCTWFVKLGLHIQTCDGHRDALLVTLGQSLIKPLACKYISRNISFNIIIKVYRIDDKVKWSSCCIYITCIRNSHVTSLWAKHIPRASCGDGFMGVNIDRFKLNGHQRDEWGRWSILRRHARCHDAQLETYKCGS